MNKYNFPKELTHENIEKQMYLDKGILLVPIEIKERLKDLINNFGVYSQIDLRNEIREIYKIINKCSK